MSQDRQMMEQMHSFVEAFATAVDERTPYNGNHTRKVKKYVLQMAGYMNKAYEKGECSEFFDEQRLEQLELAATLHDIGKMVVPLSVMNKATRLDGKLDMIEERFDYIKACTKVDMLERKISEEKYNQILEYIDDALIFLKEIDGTEFMTDDNIDRVEDIANHTFIDFNKKRRSYLTGPEKDKLCIRTGTLTSKEREIMESHVVMTEKILSKVKFSDYYKDVPIFSVQHHELMDGSGYPRGICGDDIPMESRMLAVVDIYDALTSSDRPYKKPMSEDKAFEILFEMAEKGKLDESLVTYLKESFE